MKKLLFVFLAVVCTATVASAQYKPEGSSLSTEVYYTPSVGGNGSSVSLPTYGLKLRYHLNEKFAVNLNLGYESYGDKEVTIDADNDNKDFEKTASNSFTLAPGIEYHFTKYERISPYIGAQVGVSFGSETEKEWTSYNEDYVKGKAPLFSFLAGVTAGVDIYLCKGLYTGVELGLGYRNTKEGKTKLEINTGGSETTNEGNTITSSSSFGFYAVPSIRLGWHF